MHKILFVVVAVVSLGACTTPTASSTSTSSDLEGTFIQESGGLTVARYDFYGNKVITRSWSYGTPRLDGVYVEANFTYTKTTYTTSTTLFLKCDFNQGRWVSDPSRPTGTINYTRAGTATGLLFNGVLVNKVAAGSPTTPTAGSSCTKL